MIKLKLKSGIEAVKNNKLITLLALVLTLLFMGVSMYVLSGLFASTGSESSANDANNSALWSESTETTTVTVGPVVEVEVTNHQYADLAETVEITKTTVSNDYPTPKKVDIKSDYHIKLVDNSGKIYQDYTIPMPSDMYHEEAVNSYFIPYDTDVTKATLVKSNVIISTVAIVPPAGYAPSAPKEITVTNEVESLDGSDITTQDGAAPPKVDASEAIPDTVTTPPAEGGEAESTNQSSFNIMGGFQKVTAFLLSPIRAAFSPAYAANYEKIQMDVYIPKNNVNVNAAGNKYDWEVYLYRAASKSKVRLTYKDTYNGTLRYTINRGFSHASDGWVLKLRAKCKKAAIGCTGPWSKDSEKRDLYTPSRYDVAAGGRVAWTPLIGQVKRTNPKVNISLKKAAGYMPSELVLRNGAAASKSGDTPVTTSYDAGSKATISYNKSPNYVLSKVSGKCHGLSAAKSTVTFTVGSASETCTLTFRPTISVLLLSDGYTSKDAFDGDAKAISAALSRTEPYKSYIGNFQIVNQYAADLNTSGGVDSSLCTDSAENVYLQSYNKINRYLDSHNLQGKYKHKIVLKNKRCRSAAVPAEGLAIVSSQLRPKYNEYLSSYKRDGYDGAANSTFGRVDNMNAVFMHEYSHLMGAADEYILDRSYYGGLKNSKKEPVRQINNPYSNYETLKSYLAGVETPSIATRSYGLSFFEIDSNREVHRGYAELRDKVYGFNVGSLRIPHSESSTSFKLIHSTQQMPGACLAETYGGSGYGIPAEWKDIVGSDDWAQGCYRANWWGPTETFHSVSHMNIMDNTFGALDVPTKNRIIQKIGEYTGGRPVKSSKKITKIYKSSAKTYEYQYTPVGTTTRATKKVVKFNMKITGSVSYVKLFINNKLVDVTNVDYTTPNYTRSYAKTKVKNQIITPVFADACSLVAVGTNHIKVVAVNGVGQSKEANFDYVGNKPKSCK